MVTLDEIAGALLACVFKPVIACVFNLSNDSCVKAGSFKAKPIKENAVLKYLVNASTLPPFELRSTFAPILSTASSKAALGMVRVPSFSIPPIRLITPALLPSVIGPASIDKLAETFGNR